MKTNKSFNKIAIHENRWIMKLSSIENKDKIIGLIKGFFEPKFIQETARLPKFVQRKSKLQEVSFFLCVFTAMRECTRSMEDLYLFVKSKSYGLSKLILTIVTTLLDNFSYKAI